MVLNITHMKTITYLTPVAAILGFMTMGVLPTILLGIIVSILTLICLNTYSPEK